MLKKTTLAVMGLLVSSYATAGMYSQPPAPTCVPGDVTVPCAAKQWDLGIQALYLRTVLDADKGYRFSSITTQENFTQIDNPWDWGFRLEGSYHFGTGSDITVNWTHYKSSGSQGDLIDAPVVFAPLTSPYSLDISNRFDQINAVLGQMTNAGMRDSMRFYGGLQYADIRYNLSSYFPAYFILPSSATQYVNTDFIGFGPVTGIDYAYDVMSGLSLTANAAASILYGTSRYNTGLIIPPGLIANGNFGTKKAMVPGLEGKLGLNYSYMMSGGVLNIAGGYQVTNYFNALQSRGVSNLGAFDDSDYTLYGPYFGIKWVGNA